jgi:hypothetical protein
MCVQYITINLFSGEEEEVEVEVEVEGGSEVEFHSIDDGIILLFILLIFYYYHNVSFDIDLLDDTCLKIVVCVYI